MTKTTRTYPAIVIYTARLYRWLLHLGPEAFRQDYAQQAEQDFRRYCLDAYQAHGIRGVLQLWPFLFWESLSSLLAEYMSELLGREKRMLPTIRRSMVITFWAFVVFCLSCIALNRTADPVAPFDAIGTIHPEIHIAFAIINNGFRVGLLAVLGGGLPALWIALHQAGHKGIRGILRLFAINLKQAFQLLIIAILITLCFIAYLIIVETIFGSGHLTFPGNPPLQFIILSLFSLVGGISILVFIIMAITTLFSVAILRTEFHTRMLRLTLIPIAILTVTMAVSTLATAFWILRLWIVAPSFAASSAGLGQGQTAWVVSIIVAMAIATIMTMNALWNGWKVYQAHPA